jgi:hypothetical protein
MMRRGNGACAERENRFRILKQARSGLSAATGVAGSKMAIADDIVIRPSPFVTFENFVRR